MAFKKQARGTRGDPKKRKGGKRKKPYFRKRVCRFCTDKRAVMDYKDVAFMQKFITERGRVMPSRITGTCAKHQRRLVKAIKRARFIALLPFLAR